MPARSRDLAGLRRFAEAHVGAHARAATVRPDAACACWQAQCASHEGTRIYCAGTVLLVLRHDPAIGQVWTLMEVCAACAPVMTHTHVLGKAVPVPRTRTLAATPAAPPAAATDATGAPAGVRAVAGGFSAPSGPGFNSSDAPAAPSRSRSGGRGRPQPRQGRRDQGRSTRG
ncbi:hypothetical protein [Streptomyces sp. NBC_00151]|jgi:hypothetical protein|uniref:hypothetical protein n=1 Tax=Streptomyces sp. NBC_00151 TaxID=2975669 RepID=UPI002DDB8278|nr:hypothetical protein [Streptomyces sp. NBC_00151]WRZ36649.1 hypothetical protein OG915_00110 [Streptomyces sp. NBC_00151]WRZ44924.1 hypothetical protein OG915_47425 [Streptomyces sp. NBC_00151]